jgi:asparagine synthase (glutamine-hydrolysing)
MTLFCGIASPGRNLREEETALLKKMTESLHLNNGHAGYFFSDDQIISVGFKYNPDKESPLDESKKPLTDESGEVVLFFDGFLTNSEDLRIILERNGHRIFSNNNAEVIIHFYKKEGTNSFARLNGEFCFLLYDKVKRHLHLVRDKTGSHPLYYSIIPPDKKENCFIFTNQMGVFLESGAVQRTLSEEGLYHYFTYGAAPPPNTLIKGVGKLSAGNFVGLNLSHDFSYYSQDPVQKQYWLPVSNRTSNESEDYYIEKIRKFLTEGVKRRIKGQNKLTIPLAGMDSSALLALAKKEGMDNIETFTSFVAQKSAKDKRIDTELRVTRETKNAFETKHREIPIQEEDLLDILPKTVAISPEPCAYYALPEIYCLINKMAECNADTILFGTLADALFLDSKDFYKLCNMLGGFLGKRVFSMKPFARLMHRKNSFFDAIKWKRLTPGWKTKTFELLSNGHEPYLGHKYYLTDSQKRLIFSPGFLKTNSSFSTAALVDSTVQKILKKRPDINPAEKFVALNLMLVNPETVITHLYNSLAPLSIQPRYPFVDAELVSFVLGIPLRARMKNGTPKHLLKKALSGIVPDNVLNMKKVKLGRGGYNFFKKNMGEKLEELLQTSHIIKEGDYFNLDSIKRLIRLHKKGKKGLEIYLYPLLVFLIWHQIWIEEKK